MPYVICKMVLAETPTVDITKDEYDAVKPSRAVINELIAVEEKFDAVMENYVELEQTVHGLGIRNLAFFDRHYEEMAAPLNLIGRRLGNLLSSVRLYRDALPQHAVRVLGRRHPAVEALKDSLRDSPNQPMPYRQMEWIRNYAQHVGPPISDLTFDRHKDINDKKETTGFSNSVIPLVDARAIATLRDLPADVRASFVAIGGLFNPMSTIRKYVEHVGTFHLHIRQTAKQLELQSMKAMRALLDRYAKAAPDEKLIGVAVGLENADGTISRPEYLVEHRLDYFDYMRIKHLTPVNLSMRYVPW